LHFVQVAEAMASRVEIDSNFFGSFPSRRGIEITVSRLLSAPGKCHMAGPRIAASLSPLDE